MSDSNQDKLSVHVNIEISPVALQAIVANAKKMADKNDNGTYLVDTADQVSLMVNRFLDEKDFDAFVLSIGDAQDLSKSS